MRGRLGISRWGWLASTLVPPLLLVMLSWVLLHAQGFFFVDDAYISFRYAANFAAGRGLVWNPGEAVEGYTNLLWVLLLTPFARIGWDLTFPAAVLSTICAVACLEVLRRISRRALPDRPILLSGLPGLCLVANPSFTFWATGGMEGPLFAFLCLLAVHLLLIGRDRSLSLRLAGISLALACLTRPEGALVTALLLFTELFLMNGPILQRVRRLLIPGFIVAAVLGAQLAFRLTYYGYPLPNTFYAKVLPGWISLGRGAVHLWHFMLAGGFAVIPGVLALRRNAPVRHYLIHGYVLLVTYLAYLLMIGGDLPEWFRFYVPLLPLPMLGLAEMICRIGIATTRGSARPPAASPPRCPVPGGDGVAKLPARRRLLAVLAMVAVLSLAPFAWKRSEVRLVPVLKAAGLVTRGLAVNLFRPVVPANAVTAATAVGIIGYYTPYRVIDAWGINDVHVGHLRVGAHPGRKFAHDKEDWLYVLGQAPDYVISPMGTALLPPPIPGYEFCWPDLIWLKLVVYRRVVPLPATLSGLGVPRGMRRELLLPPPCRWPPGTHEMVRVLTRLTTH